MRPSEKMTNYFADSEHDFKFGRQRPVQISGKERQKESRTKKATTRSPIVNKRQTHLKCVDELVSLTRWVHLKDDSCLKAVSQISSFRPNGWMLSSSGNNIPTAFVVHILGSVAMQRNRLLFTVYANAYWVRRVRDLGFGFYSWSQNGKILKDGSDISIPSFIL